MCVHMCVLLTGVKRERRIPELELQTGSCKLLDVDPMQSSVSVHAELAR